MIDSIDMVKKKILPKNQEELKQIKVMSIIIHFLKKLNKD